MNTSPPSQSSYVCLGLGLAQCCTRQPSQRVGDTQVASLLLLCRVNPPRILAVGPVTVSHKPQSGQLVAGKRRAASNGPLLTITSKSPPQSAPILQETLLTLQQPLLPLKSCYPGPVFTMCCLRWGWHFKISFRKHLVRARC